MIMEKCHLPLLGYYFSNKCSSKSCCCKIYQFVAILEISSRSVIAPLHTCQNFQIQILYRHCEMTLKTIPPEEVKICKEYNMMGIFSFLTFIFLRLETCAVFSEGVQLRLRFFFFFLVDEGREDSNITISGPSTARQQNAIYMLFRWRADDGPLGSFVALMGIQTSISKKHYSGGGGVWIPCPPLDPRMRN